MLRPFILIVSVLLMTSCTGQAPHKISDTSLPPPLEETKTEGYNADLAASLGADDYGMRSYVFGVLKTGPMDAKITDETTRAEVFEGHFANMSKLAEEKKLVLAGPFIEGGEKRGLYIFNVTTLEEAEALMQTDPAVVAGIFIPELTKYYGSAALMQIQDVHKTLQKTKID